MAAFRSSIAAGWPKPLLVLFHEPQTADHCSIQRCWPAKIWFRQSADWACESRAVIKSKSNSLLCLWSIIALALVGVLVSVDAKDLRAADDAKPSVGRTAKEKEFEFDGSLPKYQDLQLPAAEELLKSKPFDWVILKTADVLVVEPVSPRPDTLIRLGSDHERYLKGRAGFVEGEERLKEKRRMLQRLQVTLIDQGEDEDADYLVETRLVQRIEYFEDLLLRRASLLIEEGTIPLAYDLLMLVNRRHRENNLRLADLYAARQQEEATAKSAESERVRYTVPDALALKLTKSWPKYDEVFQNLLFKDAEIHASRKDEESALRLLENLWDHNSSYRGLVERFNEFVDRIVAPLVEREDYRQARFFLSRLVARDPQSATYAKWKETLSDRTKLLMEQARDASSQGISAEAARIIEVAARVWPETPGMRELHRELILRHQSVRVGVLRLPGEKSSYPFKLQADLDGDRLVQQPLFEPYRVDERGVRYRSYVFESWEPTDLGRRVDFTIRTKRQDWESRPVMTSSDILAELLARLDPRNPAYDDRLAGLVDDVAVRSPTELTVAFRQQPLRLEALLQFTVALGQSSLSLNADLDPQALASAGRQRFFEFQRTDAQVAFRRVRSQSTAFKTRNVDEVVEARFENWERALQALLRGEVTCLSHAGLQDVKDLQADNRFTVVPYALPRSHFLVFRPDSIPLKDAQLRRSLSLAIPREDFLNGAAAQNESSSYARLSTSFFPSNSYGNNRLLAEPAYDPQRAAALALTARKLLGGDLPELRLSCPPEATIRATALRMIEHWKRVGIIVVLNDDSNDTEATWDIAYRVDTIMEPLTDLWQLLTMQANANIESLKPLPERVRHQLLDLERANDWTNGLKLLRRISTELLIETRYIPLWELDDFFVTRRNLTGMPARMVYPYQDVERWTLGSWYPTDAF